MNMYKDVFYRQTANKPKAGRTSAILAQYPNSAEKNGKVLSDDILTTKPFRIVVGVVLTIGGVFLLGKTLKIFGKAVEDARYFVKAVKGQ